MTTQQQTDQPLDLGQRVARLEGRFDELSPRIDQLQRSVDNLGTELRAEIQGMAAAQRDDTSSLRAEIQGMAAAQRDDTSSLRVEMQAVAAAQREDTRSIREEMGGMREDASNFKNTMFALVVGTWVTTMIAIIATRLL